jgi:predicted component of type VI protein secretion system
VRAAPESAAFTIQYGTVIRSFKQPSVKFGRDASADFSFPDPRVFGNHAEVFFRQGQYFLRDLTESHATLLNGRPLAGDTPLQDNDVLELNEAGPRLRYLGAGRFAELLETRPEPPPSQPLESSPPEASSAAAGSLAGKVRSLFRR